jgi:hypothetical protein
VPNNIILKNINLVGGYLPYMIISRNTFFLILFAIINLPIPVYKLIWLATTKETKGTMYFTGHGNLGSVLGISTYPVIWFKAGRDTVFFNGNVNIPLKEGERVSVRYQKNDPTDAKINSFSCIWGDSLAYEFGPLLIFIIIFFHQDLVPKKSKVILGRNPLIRFVQA